MTVLEIIWVLSLPALAWLFCWQHDRLANEDAEEVRRQQRIVSASKGWNVRETVIVDSESGTWFDAGNAYVITLSDVDQFAKMSDRERSEYVVEKGKKLYYTG